MNTHIFYFSGTGNCLYIARCLAEKLGETELTFMPEALSGEMDLQADRIGFVFPQYHCGPPNIVKRFLARVPNVRGKYMFAVVTNSQGIPGGTLILAKKLLAKQGNTLHAGFNIHMPVNDIIRKDALPVKEQKAILEKAMVEVDHVAQAIQLKKEIVEKNFCILNWLLTGVMHPFMTAKYAAQDAHFWVRDTCTGCETCLKVCPVGNIELKDGKPTWLHHCEQCMACLQWCPRHAIEYGEKTAKRRRYHNPNVKLKDVMHSYASAKER